MRELTVDIIIPTYKPDIKLYHLLKRLNTQSHKPNKVIIINTQKEWIEEEKYRFMEDIEFIHIKQEEYDHGGTRDMGAKHSNADIILFMTQDAVPEDDTLIEHLLKPFEIKGVVATYARQLPNKDCGIIEKYTRSFNYGNVDMIKSKEDMKKLGIKTFFCSNVCAAYQRESYLALGGFVKKTIFNEDMIFAGRAVLAGYKIGYASKARVIHSHNYNNRQQLKRNFDLGVSQADYPDVFKRVKSESEGLKLVKDTIRYLFSIKKPWLVVDVVFKSGFKWIGFQLGRSYKKLPKWMIRRCTMNPAYWKK